MQKIRINFPSHSGSNIVAELNLPDSGEAKYIILYAPCFTCPRNIRYLNNMSREFTDSGVGIFRFDFPGLGESEGKFEETNFTTNLINIRLAYEYLKANYTAPSFAVGHSMGGAAMLKVASEFPEVKAVAVIAAPYKPNNLARTLAKTKAEADAIGSSKVVIGDTEFTLTKEFFADLEKTSAEHNIAELGKPLLVMHSPDDKTVSMDNAFKIFADAQEPKSLIQLNNFGHLMMRNESEARKVGKIIMAWCEQWL